MQYSTRVRARCDATAEALVVNGGAMCGVGWRCGLACVQMQQNLLLQEGDIVRLKNVSLSKGSYVKLRPHTKDFLDISNPKAVLETTLRLYTCMTVGDRCAAPPRPLRSLSLDRPRRLPPPTPLHSGSLPSSPF